MTYRGTHTPLVSKESWQRVQEILDGRFISRHRKVKHDLAFCRLIKCGYCGCSLVGEIQKKRYVYCHCPNYKMKCLDPYTREEVLEDRFADLMKDVVSDDDVLAWVKEALHQIHAEEKK